MSVERIRDSASQADQLRICLALGYYEEIMDTSFQSSCKDQLQKHEVLYTGYPFRNRRKTIPAIGGEFLVAEDRFLEFALH